MKWCLSLLGLVLISHFAIARSDCVEYKDCTVCTYIDDFTDEVKTHELYCIGTSDPNIFGRVDVGCEDGLQFATLLKRESQLPDSEYVTVRYRFKGDKGYEETWYIYNQPDFAFSFAATLNNEIAIRIATGIHNSASLLYEVDGFRSYVALSQPESQNAVKDLQERCSE